MEVIIEEIVVYSFVVVLCLVIVYFYLKRQKNISTITKIKVERAKEDGLFEPISLHPYIDLNTCIGSAACISACPEKDILGIVDGMATVINTSNCIGHGACFHACPVEAITLRIGTESRGVELPHVNENFETNVKGIYIAGELGGMGLIKNSVEQGEYAIDNIMKNRNPTEEGVLDVVIIGAGPAGISATLKAKKGGLSCITLEQDSLGGTVFTFPRSKIVMTSPMNLPLYGKVKLFNTSKDELLELWKKVISENCLDIKENTKVEGILPLKDGTFKINIQNGSAYLAQNVLLAIGRRGTPRKLNVPGEDSRNVAYRLLDAERINGKRIIVVGGGDSAVESAMLLMDQNEVILSYRKDKFARIKIMNKEKIKKAENDQKLKILFNSNIVSIALDHVLISINDLGENMRIENDLIYIFAGGELPSKFLKNAGVEITKRFGHIMKRHK